jgi:hypothetical protein
MSALGQAVLDGLEAGNRSALEQMRITREEHEVLFWPHLPESNDLPFDYAWNLNERNSSIGLTRALEQFAGQAFELIEIRFSEPEEEYPDFTLHLGARLIARRLADGEVGELPLLDVLVERGGRWKLLNFDE